MGLSDLNTFGRPMSGFRIKKTTDYTNVYVPIWVWGENIHITNEAWGSKPSNWLLWEIYRRVHFNFDSMHLQREQVPEAAKPRLEVGYQYRLPPSIRYSYFSSRVRRCGPQKGWHQHEKITNSMISSTEEALKVTIPRFQSIWTYSFNIISMAEKISESKRD